MLLNKLEHLDKRLLDKNSHLLLAQLRNEGELPNRFSGWVIH